MRKTKTFSMITLAACAALCTFSACLPQNNASDDGQAERPLVWTVADFETWETGMQLVRVFKDFGKIELNTDATYTKSGNGSARILPMGGYRTGTVPVFSFPTYSETLGFDNRDFSDANEITFEFYNAEETPVNVAVGLMTKASPSDYEATPFEYQPLAPKQWTTVSYTVNTSVLSIDKDVTDMQAIYVAFENIRSRDTADAPEIYLDDVVLTRYETAPEIENVLELDETEYLDFEKSWQKYVISARETPTAPVSTIKKASECKIGEIPEEGEADTRETLTAVSGENVLHVVMPVSEGVNTYYPGVSFSEKLLQTSMFNGLSDGEYGNTKFGFDIMYNEPEIQRISVLFFTAPSKSGTRKSMEINFPEKLKPFEWTRIEFTLKDLYERWQTKYPNNKDLFTNPGKIEITWGEFNGGKDRDFYLDNMGFTVAEKDTTAKADIIVTPFAREALVGSAIDFPTATITDKYDLTLPVTLTPYYKNGEEWEVVALKKGAIPIDKAGDYKIVATTKNSLGNVTTEEYPFKGVTQIEPNVWASYSYADETSGIFLKSAENNEVTWQQTATFEGETREGVVVAKAANASQWAAGYLGFCFAEQLLNVATDAAWDSFYIDLCIVADSPSVKLQSGSKVLATLETGKWIRLTITKEMLNGTVPSYINDTRVPLVDKAFYESFNEVLGSEPTTFMYISNIKTATHENSDVTYYIDQVVWERNENGSWTEGDDSASDIYGDEWADPFRKENE
ncbi:MAG: hypothetical protein IJX96_05125 [Clostridia bacterium]|nr:hypothetical protein [Clostridia bacterium]